MDANLFAYIRDEKYENNFHHRSNSEIMVDEKTIYEHDVILLYILVFIQVKQNFSPYKQTNVYPNQNLVFPFSSSNNSLFLCFNFFTRLRKYIFNLK